MSAKLRPFDPEAFLSRLWAMDRELVKAGFPPTSKWWRKQIERFVRALARGQRGRAASMLRRWVIRAGRRAGKSTTLCRLAVAWAWFGDWHVPAGDIAVTPFVSVSKDEAGARLRTIAAVLTALGLHFEQRGDEIELRSDRRVLFRTVAATTTAVVGFTSIAIFGDEVARWESRETAANPAREVVGSLMPTLATQPLGFAVLCSSPWGTDDYHAELFDAGDTDAQVVSFAATWTANPSITEEQTHELEADPRTWAREYAAEPGATLSAALDSADVAECFDPAVAALVESAELARGFVAIDASSLRGDAFTWIAGGITDDGHIAVREVGGFEGEQLRRVSMATVVRRIAARVQHWNAPAVFGDQREEAALRSMFAEHGAVLKSYAWSEPSKDEAMQLLRRLMRERRITLCEHATLRRELTSMKARLLPSGRIRYESGGLDYASALITLCHAIVARDVVLGEQRAEIILSDLGGSRWDSYTDRGLGSRGFG